MKHLIVCFAALIAALSSHAFSLRGPLEPWMTTNLNYGRYGDFGGPMEPGNEYRWNLPVLTYGFDQSFVDFFGERGVQAVEEAVAILNALPPASQIDLDAFPYDTRVANVDAQVSSLIDLRSAALAILIQQLGLAEPETYVWTLRAREATSEGTNYVVIQRNYDPVTLAPTYLVNDAGFSYFATDYRAGSNFTVAVAAPLPFGPWGADGTPLGQYGIAGQPINWYRDSMNPGVFYTGLTRDDAGGLRFLYHPTNINVEPLLPGITAVATNSHLVDVAPRPGVDKVTFVRMNSPITNVFADTYLTNDLPMTQMVQRVLRTPDITFRAKALGLSFFDRTRFGGGYMVATPAYRISAIALWSNNAAHNNNPGGAGPGTIPSGRMIDFSTETGPYLSELAPPPILELGIRMPPPLASFDGSASPPVVYGNTFATSATISSGIRDGSFVWKVLGTYNAVYRIDCTTNLVDWTPVTTLTNTQGYFSITNSAATPHKFYRAIRTSIPQE